MKTIEAYDKQIEFLSSGASFPAFVGGVGSGKTFALAMWICMQIRKYPGVPGLLVGPDFKRLRDALVATLLPMLNDQRLISDPSAWHTTNQEITCYGNTKIYTRSTENIDGIRGLTVGWAALDEAAYMPAEVWPITSGRLRHPDGDGRMAACSTPKGFNWMHKVWVRHSDPLHGTPVPDPEEYFMVQASSLENPFVPDKWKINLKATHGATDSNNWFSRQEIDGTFTSMSAGVSLDRAGRLEHRPPGYRWARYWDLAASAGKGDYTAGALVGQGDRWCIDDIVRERVDPKQLRHLIVETAIQDGADIMQLIEQEPGASGVAYAAEVCDTLWKRGLPAEPVIASGKKEYRIAPWAGILADGQVDLVSGRWIKGFRDECDGYDPTDSKPVDDQLDASAGAWRWLASNVMPGVLAL